MTIPLNNEVRQYFSESSDTNVNSLLTITSGLLEARSTNLNKVKLQMGRVRERPDIEEDSHYKYILRFFDLSDEEKVKLIQGILLICFLKLKQNKRKKIRHLVLDGLCWEHGKKKVHLMVLSILVCGVSIPIYWKELDKKGKSNFEERKKVINGAFKLFDLSGFILLADREYDGIKWFKYLKSKGLDFIIRLKKNAYRKKIDTLSGAMTEGNNEQKARYRKLELLAYKGRYQHCGVSKKFFLDKLPVRFVIFKNPNNDPKEPLLYFISTLENKKKIICNYPLRWKIETCFKNLQSNGFDLSKNGFIDSVKIELIMAMVVFLYVCAFVEGTIRYKQFKKSDFKTYQDGTIHLAVSIFLKGLAVLINKFHNARTFFEYINDNWNKQNLVLRV